MTAIIKMAKIPSGGNYYRNMLEGHSFRVDEKLLSRFYTLFTEVKQRLGFDQKVDFYISSDASINAFAVCSTEEGEPNIINVNSALVQLMTDDELRFVIGHEMGHLNSKNAELMQLINFVFPEGTNAPITLQYKIRLWQQLSELVADRYGFLAMPDLKVCISAFFKMSSGLDFGKVDMELDAFIEENNKRLDYFRNDKGMNLASHPINPIRVEALNLFSKYPTMTPEEFKTKVDELVSILMKIRSSELDYYQAIFIATAGLIVSSVDKDISEDEVEAISQTLSNFYIFPKNFLHEISKKDVSSLFNESIQKILENNPNQRQGLLEYIISIVMSDQEMKEDEVSMVFGMGQQVFGYSPTEIAQIFARLIQERFVPSLDALC